MKPTIRAFRPKSADKVLYRVGMPGNNKTLTFNREELEALADLIPLVLGGRSNDQTIR